MNDKDYTLVDDFFAGKLRKEELVAFDEKMKDAEFRKTVNLKRVLRQELQQRHAQNPTLDILRDEAQRFKALDQEESPNWFTRWVGWLMPRPQYALVFSLLLVVVGGFWWANVNYSDQAIARSLHEPLLDSRRAGVVTDLEVLQLARTAFFEKDYALAERYLDKLAAVDEAYIYEVQSLKAYVYFNLERYPEAIEQFDLLLSENVYDKLPASYQNRDRLRWTRLLSLLADNRKNEVLFTKELNYFLNGKSDLYREKARQIADKLKSPWRKLVLD